MVTPVTQHYGNEIRWAVFFFFFFLVVARFFILIKLFD